VKPLDGRELGIARSRLCALAYNDADQVTAVERVEYVLAWFVNGDGVAYPTIETLRHHLAECGQQLHRTTIAGAMRQLPHYLTVGYFARNGFNAGGGALRGVAVRMVRPEVAEELGFPPAAEAIERLQMYRWLLLTSGGAAVSEATSGEAPDSRIPPLKSPAPRRHRKNATRRSLSMESGDVATFEGASVSRARARDGAGRGDAA
jgi:hypothetical protein